MVSSCGGEWAAQMPGIGAYIYFVFWLLLLFISPPFVDLQLTLPGFVRGLCGRNRQTINHYSRNNEWKLIYYAAAIAFGNG